MQETLSGFEVAQVYSFTPPLLMPMKAGFFDSPCFSVSVGVPGVPLFARILPARIGRNEGNVKTPAQQFRFGLGLVVPITGLPRPRIAGRRLVWHDHDAPLLTLGRSANRKAFFFRPRKRSDGQGLVIHDEVVTDKP